MSGIPSWARPGVKVVAVERTGGDLDAWSGLAIGPNDIFTLIQIKQGASDVWCRTRHDETGFEHEPTEWARLSRFRPLVTLEDDITTYFADLLDTPVNRKVEA